jgi:hypothetical protein
MSLYEVDQRGDFYRAHLDHLGEEEALGGWT